MTAAEQVSGSKHPRVALVLTVLADLYARTQRITMAEGLFRCAQLGRRGGSVCGTEQPAACLCRTAASVLGLRPDAQGAESPPAYNGHVHHSAAALVAWRCAGALVCAATAACELAPEALCLCRYAQLLQALPKRETETQAWSALAGRLCQGARQPQNMFGSLDVHRESSSRGEGLALDLVSQRAFRAPS